MRNKTKSNGWVAGLALLVAGGSTLLTTSCAQVPAETRILGTRIPVAWIDRAEGGEAQACVAVSRKLRDTDALEALRFLRKGTELHDGDCCRQYLSLVEGGGFNYSQRLYARLFIEHVLRQGPVRTVSGKDVTLDLLYQLCWAWRCTEPRSPVKARRALEAMFDRGLSPEMAKSEFLREMIAEAARSDHDPRGRRRSPQEIGLGIEEEPADERSGWLQISSVDAPPAVATGWIVTEATAWAGGSDRLLFATGVLAFLVNDRGEPCYRGRQLWIRNCSSSPVYYTSSHTGLANHELLPGAEELRPVESHALDENGNTTGIPLTVRFRPSR